MEGGRRRIPSIMPDATIDAQIGIVLDELVHYCVGWPQCRLPQAGFVHLELEDVHLVCLVDEEPGQQARGCLPCPPHPSHCLDLEGFRVYG